MRRHSSDLHHCPSSLRHTSAPLSSHVVILADSLTYSRGVVAAVVGGSAATSIHAPRGRAGWTLWAFAVWAATFSDWVDGPLARTKGSVSRGHAMDLEADSWLTLWVAIAVVRWQRLPAVTLVAPFVRYLLPAVALLSGTYDSADLGRRWWARASGVAQMALLLTALAPRQPACMDVLLTRLAWPVAAMQLLVITRLFWRIVTSETCTLRRCRE